jgi:hypothetical protein
MRINPSATVEELELEGAGDRDGSPGGDYVRRSIKVGD